MTSGFLAQSWPFFAERHRSSRPSLPKRKSLPKYCTTTCVCGEHSSTHLLAGQLEKHRSHFLAAGQFGADPSTYLLAAHQPEKFFLAASWRLRDRSCWSRRSWLRDRSIDGFDIGPVGAFPLHHLFMSHSHEKKFKNLKKIYYFFKVFFIFLKIFELLLYQGRTCMRCVSQFDLYCAIRNKLKKFLKFLEKKKS